MRNSEKEKTRAGKGFKRSKASGGKSNPFREKRAAEAKASAEPGAQRPGVTVGHGDVKMADSMKHAAGILGEDIALLKAGKAAGCPAFVGSRVDLEIWRTWIAANPISLDEVSSIDELEKRKLQKQIEKLEMEIEQGREKVWKCEDARAAWLKHMRRAKQVLLELPNNLAAQLVGRTIHEIHERLTEAADKVLAELRSNPYGGQ